MGKPYIRPIVTLAEIPHRGPVMLYDDIEGTFKWTGAGTGAGYTCAKSTVKPFFDSNALALITRQVGSNNGDSVQGSRTFSLNPSKFIEFSCYFYLLVHANIQAYQVQIKFDNGSDIYMAELYYHAVTPKWIYIDTGGSTQDIPSANIALAQATWHKMRFSVNIEKETWDSFTINNAKHDMSSIALRKAATNTEMTSSCFIYTKCTAAGFATSFTDDILISEILT